MTKTQNITSLRTMMKVVIIGLGLITISWSALAKGVPSPMHEIQARKAASILNSDEYKRINLDMQVFSFINFVANQEKPDGSKIGEKEAWEISKMNRPLFQKYIAALNDIVSEQVFEDCGRLQFETAHDLAVVFTAYKAMYSSVTINNLRSLYESTN